VTVDEERREDEEHDPADRPPSLLLAEAEPVPHLAAQRAPAEDDGRKLVGEEEAREPEQPVEGHEVHAGHHSLMSFIC
jgi:hypothetical protein